MTILLRRAVMSAAFFFLSASPALAQTNGGVSAGCVATGPNGVGVVTPQCAAPDQNTTLTRAGTRLLDQIPVSRENAIWAVSNAYSNHLDSGALAAKGTTYFAAAGLDRVLGPADDWLIGAGLAYLDGKVNAPASGGRAGVDVDVTGFGPIGYLSYEVRPAEGDSLQLTVTGAYFFLDSNSAAIAPFGGVEKRAADGAGGSVFANASAAYFHGFGKRRNLIGAATGFRLASNRFKSPLLFDRTDTSFFVRGSLEYEVAYNVSISGGVGADVPLSNLYLGRGDAQGRLRAPDLIFEYRAGFHFRPQEDWDIYLQGKGATGEGLRELGGLLTLRFTYDRRDSPEK